MTDRLQKLSDNELQLSIIGLFNYAHTDNDAGERVSVPAVYPDHRGIHNEYLNIYKTSTELTIKTEVLKRLVFLNWFYLAEPSVLTGITVLDDDTMFEAYEILNDILKNNGLDTEFKWMLALYSKWDYTIFEFSEDGLDALTAFVKEHRWETRLPPTKEQIEGKMDNRGLMGKHLKALGETIL